MSSLENMPKSVKNEILERQARDKELQKKLAKDANQLAYESPVKLKDIKDAKTYAAIEFLLELPAWRKRLGELKMDSEISAETMNLVVGWMANPKNQYEDGKWVSQGQLAGAELHRRAEVWKQEEQAEFEKAKTEFENKFGNKIKIWETKGFKVEDMDSLVKAYMKDKDLDLVTTKDKKVVWGTPEAGYASK